MGSFRGTVPLLLGYALVLGAMLAMLRLRGGPRRTIVVAPAWALVGTAAAATAGALVVGVARRLAGDAIGSGIAPIVMVASLLATGGMFARWLTPPSRAERLKRGTRLAPGPASARLASPSDSRLRFAGLPLTTTDETKHFKLIGTTGTGKSTAIRALLEGALARGDRAVFADPDGGYLARFHDPTRGDVILNPFDSRARAWDLFRELRTPYDYDQLARSLVGEGNGAEESWRGYAQIVLASVLKRAHALPTCSVRELYRLVTAAPLDELRVLLDGSPAHPFLEPGNERMFGSVRAVLTARTTALDYLGRQDSVAFSIRDWVESGTGVLFLPYQADQIAALHSIISSWLRIAIFQTMSQGERDHRIWFVIDELDALGGIDGLKDALARLRKFGGRCVLGFQSIAQVAALYGSADSQTIVENCGNTLILRCSASEQGGTARFASRLIGEREIVRETLSRSRGTGLGGAARGSETISSQQLVEPAVLPSEVEQLPDLVGFAKLASVAEWVRVELAP